MSARRRRGREYREEPDKHGRPKARLDIRLLRPASLARAIVRQAAHAPQSASRTGFRARGVGKVEFSAYKCR